VRAFTRPESLIAWAALLTAIGSPFLFGAVERTVWLPLCVFWLIAGLVQSQLTSNRDTLRPVLLLHALFAIQLIPLPASILRAISPGSYAAHFLPDRGAFLRPLSVSPSATSESWLYFAAMLGLFIALRPLREHRRPALFGLIAGLLALAVEGFLQSRSTHPYWLLGSVPPVVPNGLETSIFGPYFNRNHFATLMALGASISCGVAASYYADAQSLSRLASSSSALPRTIMLVGCAGFFSMACAATGSRSGLFALMAGVSAVGMRRIPWRWVMAGLSGSGVLLLLAGPFVLERLLKLDFVASRLAPWADMTTLVRFFPIFGSGIGTFSVAYWPYQRNVPYEFWIHAHNEYLQWLIEAGVVGVVALTLTIRSVRAQTAFHAHGDAGAAALVVFAAQSLLDFPLRVPANAAILAAVLALTLAARSEDPVVPEPGEKKWPTR